MVIHKTSVPKYLYKVVSPNEWKVSEANKIVQKGEIDETFIHLSTLEQLDKTIEKFWSNKPYVVLKVEVSRFIGELIYEANPGHETKYYHLYDGNIPITAVVTVQCVV